MLILVLVLVLVRFYDSVTWHRGASLQSSPACPILLRSRSTPAFIFIRTCYTFRHAEGSWPLTLQRGDEVSTADLEQSTNCLLFSRVR